MIAEYRWRGDSLYVYSDETWCDDCKEHHSECVGTVGLVGPNRWLACAYDIDGNLTDQMEIKGTKREAKEWVQAVVRLS